MSGHVGAKQTYTDPGDQVMDNDQLYIVQKSHSADGYVSLCVFNMYTDTLTGETNALDLLELAL